MNTWLLSLICFIIGMLGTGLFYIPRGWRDGKREADWAPSKRILPNRWEWFIPSRWFQNTAFYISLHLALKKKDQESHE